MYMFKFVNLREGNRKH